MAGKGIILTDAFDIDIVNGSMVIGESEMQEVAVILSLNQGDLKFAPVLGPSLVRLKKANKRNFEIEQAIRVHLAIDNKDYSAIKNKINVHV